MTQHREDHGRRVVLARERALVLHRNTPASAASGLLAVIAIAFVVQPANPTTSIVAWLALVLIVTAGRWAWARRALRRHEDDPDPQRTLRVAGLLAVCAGVSYAAGIWFLFPGSALDRAVLVVVLALAMSAGAFATLSASPITLGVFVTVTVIPAVTRLTEVVDGNPVWMIALAALYPLIAVTSVRHAGSALSRMIELRLRSEDREAALRWQESRLRESEAKYRALFERSEDSMWILSDGVFVDANDGVARTLGYDTADDVRALRPHEISPAVQPCGTPSEQLESRYLDRALRDGYARFDWVHRHRDGSHVPMEISLTRVTIDDRPALFCVGRDQSELARARAIVEDERRRLQEVIEASRLGTWEWDVRTGEIEVNETWAAMIGHRLDDLRPTTIDTWKNCVHPDDLARSEEALERHFRGESPFYEVEARMRHRDGHWVWVLDRGRVVRRDDHGRPLQVYGTHADISARKRAEETLHRTMRELEHQTAVAQRLADEADRANRAKSTFLATMSHELRTPMNGIMGILDLLAGADLDDDLRGLVGVGRASSEHLLVLLDEILEYTEIEAGRVDLEDRSFDVDEVVDRALTPHLEAARAKGLDVERRRDPSVPDRLRGDPRRIRQVLEHLVGNAVKFTEHGSVRVHVSVDDTEPTPRLRFDVIDSGIGIPEGRVRELFESFTQADGSTTRRFGGVGLGLAIVERAVHLLGGRVGVESDEGHGSRFWFTTDLIPADEGVDVGSVDRPEPSWS
jgi:PAS domain S-box-containing protein